MTDHPDPGVPRPATGDEGPARTADRPSGPGRRRWPRVLLVVVVVLVVLLAVATTVWVLRYPDAEPAPLAAVLDDPDLEVEVTDDLVTIGPAGATADTTIVFYPGAAVPPVAYLATWGPVVEETGVAVAIPSVPLRLAVLDVDAAEDVRDVLVDGSGIGGEADTWWVGGHSLGGAMASSFVGDETDDTWDGLVLWASYPSGDALASRDDLAVLSVSGTRDGLTTPDDVEASRADLPPDATFAVLDGVNHAQFGAYGDQSGDGTATVDDATARRLIAEAVTAALAE